jgi:hypothetical protein
VFCSWLMLREAGRLVVGPSNGGAVPNAQSLMPNGVCPIRSWKLRGRLAAVLSGAIWYDGAQEVQTEGREPP